jgi:hypothetical protein
MQTLSSLLTRSSVSQWKDISGLISGVECDASGTVLKAEGAAHSELPTITNSFMQLGNMLGKAVGAAACEEVLIEADDKSALFVLHNGKHIGLEFQPEKA